MITAAITKSITETAFNRLPDAYSMRRHDPMIVSFSILQFISSPPPPTWHHRKECNDDGNDANETKGGNITKRYRGHATSC